MKRRNIIIAILGGMLLGCCISVSIPIIKVNVLTNRYGDELEDIVVNYILVVDQAEAEGNLDLYKEVATGEELSFLERTHIFPLSINEIITDVVIDSFQVSNYNESRATISVTGNVFYYNLYYDTGEISKEWDTPFGHTMTLVKEDGVWKVSERHPLPFYP
jgi:hypothetical protein